MGGGEDDAAVGQAGAELLESIGCGEVEANINLDLTAADALEELRARLADRGVIFATTHLRSELRAVLSRTGWVDRVGADQIVRDTTDRRSGLRAMARRPSRYNPRR